MADLNVQLVLKLVDRATAPARAAIRAIERVGGEGLMRQAQQVAAGARMMGRGMEDVRRAALRGAAVAVGYTGTMTALAGTFLGPAAEMERFQVQLRNLEGSSEGAEKAMSWIMDFATRTPLELNQTVSAYARLRAFGIDPTNGSMQALVDTMAASGGGVEQMDGLVLALGQAWTKGKLQGEEALQLLERGVPVWDLLGQKMGKTAAELQEMSSKGQLGREQITLLIEAMGERNLGASDAMSKTWEGITSKMSDFWYQFRIMTMNSGVFDYLKNRLNEIFTTLDTMASDGRLQAIADKLAGYMLTALDGLWRFAMGVGEAWSWIYPKVAAVAEMLGGWDNLGWLALAVIMRGTLMQLALGFGRVGLGAGQAALGILTMLSPLNIIRTAALAWMATGFGAALTGIALAGIWIWRNWSGLAAFFAELWTSFREALGPAAPMLDGLLDRFAAVRDWVMSITGPIDESGESWRRWGRAVGMAIGGTVRAIKEWLDAHPAMASALGYLIAGLGMLRLLVTPVSAGFQLATRVAAGLGRAFGIAARVIASLSRAFMALRVAVLSNPIVAVVSAIAGAAYLIYANWERVGPWFSRLWGNVTRYFAGFSEFVIGIFTLDLSRAWQGIRTIWSAAGGFYKTLWDGIAGIFRSSWNIIGPILDRLGLLDPLLAAWTSFRDAIGVILDWMASKFEAVWSRISPLIDGLKWVADKGVAAANAVSGAVSNAFSGDVTPVIDRYMQNNPAMVPQVAGARALGGPVRAGQIYRWREEGRELFMPRVDGDVISNRQLRAIETMQSGSGIRIVQGGQNSFAGAGRSQGARRIDIGGITINASPGMDPRAIGQEVRRQIQALAREADFNLHDGADYA